MYRLILRVLFLFVCGVNGNIVKSITRYHDHQRQKENILNNEEATEIGGAVMLNCDEQYANRILVRMKKNELSDGFKNNSNDSSNNFSHNFLEFKEEISNSKIYKAIKLMPKGAVLHVHAGMMIGGNDLIEFTYENNLYVCESVIRKEMSFYFSKHTPNATCKTSWKLLSELRSKAADVGKFDNDLKSYFSVDAEDVHDLDGNAIWKLFEKKYRAMASLLSYRPVKEKVFRKALQKFYDDNILYIEIRSGLSQLYELDGTLHDPLKLLEIYEKITKQFTADNPDFVGVKYIFTKSRRIDNETLHQTLDLALNAKKAYPDLLIGFDLVGQEDRGNPLEKFAPLLLEYQSKLDYYFHAGETDWFGTSHDENLIEAILLKTKRIGHGYALAKHPKLMQMIKEKGIAIEVNVISNNVLGLVKDVRNHPLTTFFALDLPVVISSDDPGMWGADPLSHDFYVAFMGVLNGNGNIRTLKQFVINSIKYSAMDGNMRSKALSIFHRKWNNFIKDFIRNYA